MLLSISPSALDLFRLIPMLVHIFERNLRPGSSLLGDSLLNVAEAAAEFAIRGLERALRLHAVPAGQVGDDEKYVADLAGDGVVVYIAASNLFAKFSNLFFEF